MEKQINLCFLRGRQVLALQIFNTTNNDRFAIIKITDDRLNRF